jgi:hypothetical protein
MNAMQLNPADLAPGDQRSRELDLSALQFQQIRSTVSPLFRIVYDRLWQEFGDRHEIESEEVLAARLADHDPAMRYELIAVLRDGRFAAARDHTVITSVGETVVHLSHLLIAPEERRSGLAGWMRALPIATARAMSPGKPITLVGEMEPPDGIDQARDIRLRAYEKAGFVKIDPKEVPYRQPDFRPLTEIDTTGGPRPLPMQLIVRRVAREREPTMPRREVRHVIESLYHMYARDFRPADMAPCLAWLTGVAPDSKPIRLLPPTA